MPRQDRSEMYSLTIHTDERVADRDFMNISDGQRQRVMLARAICQEPEIIILDEPTAALDPISENRLYETYDNVMKVRRICIPQDRNLFLQAKIP